MNDLRYVRCASWREILSARLDGEESAEEAAAAQRHLDGCADCRDWLDGAAAVNRRVRTRAASPLPDLTDAILAAAPPRRLAGWRVRLVAALRVALGVLGAGQLVLGLAQAGRGALTDHLHPAGQHLWHEAAAWNVAVGAGFVFVALRRTPPAGLLPTLSAFVATLVLLSVNDVLTARVDVSRLVSHALLLGGWLVTVLLSRPALRAGRPPPVDGRAGRSRWRLRLDEAEQPAVGPRPAPPYGARAAVQPVADPVQRADADRSAA
ncbi:zf-HC2 domain-containing protein [Micromonospora halophytica]|uniref:Predicted anti-sigma-YlaC factor YlaD, contains Zn-finger domain n=1 Tax=Micromonospora halophytica TaxID=47864 RepID=A0A1C5HJA2_9ACTN|nr:zf-HC2 domain-containing protein [Micromonospora halophytica]SCG46106.1 Predicted anti-sigma-YlaC factor YlaD, contains Zn-finger domain [Micromonospora halophytica]